MWFLRVLIAVLAVGGVIDSALALRIHYQDPSAAPPCAVTETWDCGAVNHSRFAVLPPSSFDEDPAAKKTHVPVAFLGLAGYALIAVLALAGQRFWVLQCAEVGFAFAAMLSYMEAFVLEKWCIYCVWSQGLITAILLCAVVWMVLARRQVRRVALPS
jgi:vitamin-K-epoxide reductase (warfarin-sensitive)